MSGLSPQSLSAAPLKWGAGELAEAMQRLLLSVSVFTSVESYSHLRGQMLLNKQLFLSNEVFLDCVSMCSSDYITHRYFNPLVFSFFPLAGLILLTVRTFITLSL